MVAKKKYRFPVIPDCIASSSSGIGKEEDPDDPVLLPLPRGARGARVYLPADCPASQIPLAEYLDSMYTLYLSCFL